MGKGYLGFLTSGPVFHPKKPEKVRVVFGCAREIEGHFSQLRTATGPGHDQLPPWCSYSVPTRTVRCYGRHRVHVLPSSCSSQRFGCPTLSMVAWERSWKTTWRVPNGSSFIQCSFFSKLRELRFKESSRRQLELQWFVSESTNTVKGSFYVDDCFKSVPGEEEAIRQTDDLRNLLEKGRFQLNQMGFKLSQGHWVPSCVQKNGTFKDLHDGQLPIKSALRVRWDVERDKFCFKIEVESKPLTRRGLLSVVCSLYDPLDFVAPIVLPAKVIRQDLCRRRLEWDDPIPDDERNRWLSWLEDLAKLEQLSVDRCLKSPSFGKVVSVQLRHFSDASQQGYGAVSYLSFLDDKEAIYSSFVMGKARTAPLKTVTIPGLKLSAAVEASRLNKTFRKEIDIPVDESVFWTDSSCVISYIQTNEKRFHTFVANRIAIIHNATSASQWKYVNSEGNPADDASRGLTVDSIIPRIVG